MASLMLDTDEERVSYGVGFQTGLRVISSAPTSFLNLDALIAGMCDGFEQSAPRISIKEVQEATERLQAALEAARRETARNNSARSELFLQHHADRDGVIELRSGVLYEPLRTGDGPRPTEQSRVLLSYRAWLPDGRPLDASPPGLPIEVHVSSVLPGWRHALLHMPAGSRWNIYIPSELAHGASGNGPIPPHTALGYEIELVQVLS